MNPEYKLETLPDLLSAIDYLEKELEDLRIISKVEGLSRRSYWSNAPAGASEEFSSVSDTDKKLDVKLKQLEILKNKADGIISYNCQPEKSYIKYTPLNPPNFTSRLSFEFTVYKILDGYQARFVTLNGQTLKIYSHLTTPIAELARDCELAIHHRTGLDFKAFEVRICFAKNDDGTLAL